MMKRKWENNDFSFPIVCVKLARGPLSGLSCSINGCAAGRSEMGLICGYVARPLIKTSAHAYRRTGQQRLPERNFAREKVVTAGHTGHARLDVYSMSHCDGLLLQKNDGYVSFEYPRIIQISQLLWQTIIREGTSYRGGVHPWHLSYRDPAERASASSEGAGGE